MGCVWGAQVWHGVVWCGVVGMVWYGLWGPPALRTLVAPVGYHEVAEMRWVAA